MSQQWPSDRTSSARAGRTRPKSYHRDTLKTDHATSAALILIGTAAAAIAAWAGGSFVLETFEHAAGIFRSM